MKKKSNDVSDSKALANNASIEKNSLKVSDNPEYKTEFASDLTTDLQALKATKKSNNKK